VFVFCKKLRLKCARERVDILNKVWTENAYENKSNILYQGSGCIFFYQ
jgi:hypothetical protein